MFCQKNVRDIYQATPNRAPRERRYLICFQQKASLPRSFVRCSVHHSKINFMRSKRDTSKPFCESATAPLNAQDSAVLRTCSIHTWHFPVDNCLLVKSQRNGSLLLTAFRKQRVWRQLDAIHAASRNLAALVNQRTGSRATFVTNAVFWTRKIMLTACKRYFSSPFLLRVSKAL